MDKDVILEQFNEAEEPDKKVNLLLQLVDIYISEQDISSAFKYAAIASVCTSSPRADVCCLLGDLYVTIGNIKWANKWYKAALNSVPTYKELDTKYYTWYPLVCLGNIATTPDEIKKYLEAAELFNPNYIEDMQGLKA